MKLRWPLDGDYTHLSTKYGELLGSKPHNAVDISAPDGAAVYAPYAGSLLQDYTPAGGNTAKIVNGSYITRLCHLSEPVGVARYVQAGDQVGKVGRSGTAWTGFHLHWEMKLCGEPVNPLSYLPKEGAMPSKCLFRYQGQNPVLPAKEIDYIKASGMEDALIINPDWGINRDKPLNCPIAARFWFDGEPDKQLVYDGAAGAEKWLAMIRPRFQAAQALGWRSIAVTSPNEVYIGSLEQVRQLNAFSLRAQELVRNELGVAFWAYSYSEGNPPYTELNKYHADSAAHLAVIALHEYRMGWQHTLPAEKDTWHMLRYRRMAASLAELGVAMPEVRITEHGIDSPAGWRNYVSAPQQMVYLADYETACLQDSYVKAIYPFIWNNYPGQWEPFSMSGDDINPLYFDHIRQHRENIDDSIEQVLAVANTHVIAQVPDFALYKHITGNGLVLASGEFSIGSWVYQWAYDREHNTRILYRTQAPRWAIEEYRVVPN